MDCTSRETDRTSGKWIVHQGNGSYLKEMDRTLLKWSYIKDMDRATREMDRTSRELGRTGKELGQQSESQARITSAMFVRSVSSAFRVNFKSEVLLD